MEWKLGDLISSFDSITKYVTLHRSVYLVDWMSHISSGSDSTYGTICWHLVDTLKFSILKRKILVKLFYIFKFFSINLFIFGHVGSFAACGLSLVAASRAILHCGARASHCSGFSCCRARTIGAQASVVAACGLSSCGSQALEHRFSSCGARA